jgi:hypothetical protein
MGPKDTYANITLTVCGPGRSQPQEPNVAFARHNANFLTEPILSFPALSIQLFQRKVEATVHLAGNSSRGAMDGGKNEVYIQIVPLKNADHKRVIQNKSNPLQRVKVSTGTCLSTLASYVHKLAGSDSQEVTIELLVPYGDDSVQVPLSWTAAEFLLITNQESEGELRYTFADGSQEKPKKPAAAPAVHVAPTTKRTVAPSRSKAQKVKDETDSSMIIGESRHTRFDYPIPEPLPRMEPPPQPKVPFLTVPSIPFVDSMNHLFPGGFSMFSDSFGPFSTFDSIGFRVGNSEPDRPPESESSSLRDGLEAFLRNK